MLTAGRRCFFAAGDWTTVSAATGSSSSMVTFVIPQPTLSVLTVLLACSAGSTTVPLSIQPLTIVRVSGVVRVVGVEGALEGMRTFEGRVGRSNNEL